MRIPAPLAWLLILMTLFTSGLLRQFHDKTPVSPLATPIVGSALFAGIFLLLLVSAREWRRGAVAGPGMRLGSLTPLLLMLLIEKWISITLYPLLFPRVFNIHVPERWLDAQFVAFAGVGLILVCLLVGRLSTPSVRKTWRRARPSRWPLAALGTAIVVLGSYFVLGALSAALGGGLRIKMPELNGLLFWVVIGQSLLAFGEELYYRGLLMSEAERLAPRLGFRSATARRWTALLSTAFLFGMEHLTLGPPWSHTGRQMIFTIALGVLFGILVMLTANLHFAAGVHAWINCLLLGAAPYFVDSSGQPALPSGTYIGLTLILAFVLSFVFQTRRRQQAAAEPGALLDEL